MIFSKPAFNLRQRFELAVHAAQLMSFAKASLLPSATVAKRTLWWCTRWTAWPGANS